MRTEDMHAVQEGGAAYDDRTGELAQRRAPEKEVLSGAALLRQAEQVTVVKEAPKWNGR